MNGEPEICKRVKATRWGSIMSVASRAPERILLGFILLFMTRLQPRAEAFGIPRLRQMAASQNISCMLVFGDSSVDPGNNNRLPTTFKGNFLPYGKDFFQGRPTGRFSNGRLPTDFIAEDLGLAKAIPAFLDEGLSKEGPLHGVSFASAASGYDDLTANLTEVLSFSKQIDYLVHYKLHLSRLVGAKQAAHNLRRSIFILSAGTNDFIQNYYLEPIRPKQFTLDAYMDFLVSRMSANIKAMNKIGGTRFLVVGVPPIGCIPLIKTLEDTMECVDSYNRVAQSFNSKIKAKLVSLGQELGIRAAFVDSYGVLLNAINNPKTYGFTETSKGCCGTGTTEVGDTCKGQNTCEDPSKYVFWDAIHPTERMYRLIADDIIKSSAREILY